MKNGGSLCLAGGLLLAMAAKSFSVPFIIISAMYKLTPKYPLN
jgi:translation initiation factor 2B subunit (eIF-2B alpha/beta/delta family)